MLAYSASELAMESRCSSLSGESLLTSDSGGLASLTYVMVKDGAWGGGGGETVGGEQTDRVFLHLPLSVCLLGNWSSQLF